MFTILVAPAFVIMSVYALGEASIPAGVLGVLGLSQVTYVVGKFAVAPTLENFNKQVKDFREKNQKATATQDEADELMDAFDEAMGETWPRAQSPLRPTVMADQPPAPAAGPPSPGGED